MNVQQTPHPSRSLVDMQELKCPCCLQDVVTRGGKFLFLYKRPGKRVIVNDFGHFIVSPNSIEASIQQNTVGTYQPHCRVQAIKCMLSGFALICQLSLLCQAKHVSDECYKHRPA